ncbi:MAG: hypothetical protein AAFV90_12435 [Cyanobacteria bacterium J06634_5]
MKHVATSQDSSAQLSEQVLSQVSGGHGSHSEISEPSANAKGFFKFKKKKFFHHYHH